MKILVTGFNAFSPNTINSSWEAVRNQSDEIWGVPIVKVQLPTEYYEAVDLLVSAAKMHKPDVILSFGLHGGYSYFRPEKLGYNIGNQSVADNAGVKIPGLLYPGDGERVAQRTTDADQAVSWLAEAPITGQVSTDPGDFVCNSLCYGWPRAAALDPEIASIPFYFTHIPGLPGMTANQKRPLAEMVGSVRRMIEGAALMIGATDPPPEPVPSETVVINGHSNYEARDQFRAALSVRGLTYETVTELPFLLDTSQSTNLNAMLFDCKKLTSVRPFDTSNATQLREVFGKCEALTEVPDLDMSSAVDIYGLFGNCSSLTSVPSLNTSSVTNMAFLFSSCTSLTHAPVLDTGQVTDMSSMFRSCSSLVYVPDMQTSNVASVVSMFNGTGALTDGNVRMIGKKAGISTQYTRTGSGLTRFPFFDTEGNPI